MIYKYVTYCVLILQFKLLKEEKEKELTKKDEKIQEVSNVLRSQEDEINNLRDGFFLNIN